MIRQLRTWFRESDIFKPFNPPAHQHPSPKRPADWATRMTLAQAFRALGKATRKASKALKAMGVSMDKKQKFATGGVVNSPHSIGIGFDMASGGLNYGKTARLAKVAKLYESGKVYHVRPIKH